MLLSNIAVMKWNSKNKKYFQELGYKYTKMKDLFLVKTKDLKPYSIVKIYVACDYCGKIHRKTWDAYYHSHQNTDKDCCSNSECISKKAQESLILKYGDTPFCLDDVKRKIVKTNIEKYGAENPFASKEIQEKIKETNIKKYGFAVPTQNPLIMQKSKDTCVKRYGVENYGAIYSAEHTKELSPTWKGGVKHHRVERSTYEYRHWRKSIFERDDYTCQCCGAKNGNGHSIRLEAHHIENWNDNVESRYDIDNGITLCNRCHIDFHIMYKKKSNTSEQIKEFINKYKTDKKVC